MSLQTKISWCDSTLNLESGCDGCELWQKNNRICYAGRLTELYAGSKGWPVSFDKPIIFHERAKYIESWSDLTGKERPDKPWLNSYPRLIFLNDMGDTFTESLPLDWLMPFVPRMEASPHIFQILTKRPKRMASFFESLGYIPDNFWLGISVTDQNTLNARLPHFLRIDAKTKFISYEPMLESINFPAEISDISQIIFGGESGSDFREMSLDGLRHGTLQCQKAGVSVFVKQDSGLYPDSWGRIPEDLRIREMPKVNIIKMRDAQMEMKL